jgi:putative component of toxin-antitoxin plasmid stabilization module
MTAAATRPNTLAVMNWNIEFFREDTGSMPAREWLYSLPAPKRAAAIAAIEYVLAQLGPDVCRTEYGKPLGKGLFEFRIRHDAGVILRKAGQSTDGVDDSEAVLIRIFCHAYGDRIVLLLGGYDKGAAPSDRRQQREIETARKRLRSHELRQKRNRSGKKRRR